MGTETRERILEAGAALVRRQGYEATGIKQIAAAARAPFGSLYHFFPGGKEELGAEIVRRAGARYGRLFPAVLDRSPDLVQGVRAFFAAAAVHLEESDFADACPIATVALESSSRSETLRAACAEVFEAWITDGTERVVDAGVPPERARSLVVGLLGALEGAFVLCRAARSTEALEVAGAAGAAATAAALAGDSGPGLGSR
ncbi:MAG TPA: TetR/AcrR family transcriptional regulator [Acidimicrobiales bacterium]|nr:TetR/AcrR family transcriptional regulator [Acidimicrobiales bacterium]